MGRHNLDHFIIFGFSLLKWKKFLRGSRGRQLCNGREEYSPPKTAVDLSDLVKSFMERGESGGGEGGYEEVGEEREGFESEGDCRDTEVREVLRGLLLGCGDDDDEVEKYL